MKLPQFDLKIVWLFVTVIAVMAILAGYKVRNSPQRTWCEVAVKDEVAPSIYLCVVTARDNKRTFSIERATMVRPSETILSAEKSEKFLDGLMGDHDGVLEKIERSAVLMLAERADF